MAPERIDARYHIVRTLSTGAHGRVYLVTDELNDAVPVALKTLRHGPDEDSAVSLASEFEVLRRLSHPNVAHIHEFGRDNRLGPFFTMEYVEGGSLVDLPDLGAKPRLVRSLLRQSCTALEYLHSRGVVHGDIKPGNVLVSPNGRSWRLKLIDFGLASMRGSHGGQSPRGTPAYVAPEVLQGLPPGLCSDYYSAGAVFYEALAGRPPHTGRDFTELADSVLYDDPPPLHQVCPKAPMNLSRAVMRMLAKSPTGRCTSLEDLNGLLGRGGRVLSSGSRLTISLESLGNPQYVDAGDSLKTVSNAFRTFARRNAQGTVALVSGEQGSGKSRLATEFLRSTQLQGHAVLRIDCASESSGPVWSPRSLASHVARLTSARVSPGQARAVGEAGRRLEESIELSQEKDTAGPFLEFLARTSELLPLALVFDDAHLAREWLLELLRRLPWSLPRLRVFALVLWGTDAAPVVVEPFVLDGEKSESSLLDCRLAPLARAHIESFVASMAPCRQVSCELVEHLEASTGGNPLLLIETVRDLASRRRIAVAAGELSLHGPGALPASASLAALLRSRLENLDVIAKEALCLVVAAETPLARRDLAELCRRDVHSVVSALHSMSRKGLITEVAAGGGWSTHNVGVREAVKGILGPRRMRKANTRLAEFFDGRRNAPPHFTAAYFARAGCSQKALQLGVPSAGELISRGEYNRAERLLESLSRACRKDPSEMSMVIALRAELEIARGRMQAAIDCLSELLSNPDSDASERDVRHWRRMKAHALMRLGRCDEAQDELTSAEIPSGAQDADRERLEQTRERGHVLLARGMREAALEAHRSALDTARRLSEVRLEGEILRDVAGVLYSKHDFVEAERHCRLALECFKASGWMPGQILSEMSLGSVHYLAGRDRQALRAYERAMGLAEGVDDVARVSDLSGLMAMCQFRIGQGERAIESLERCLEGAASAADPLRMATALSAIARTSRCLGHYDRMMHCLDRYSRLLSHLPPTRVWDYLAQRVAALSAVGDLAEAERCARELLSWASEQGDGFSLAIARWLLGYVLGTTGDRERGVGLVADAKRYFDDAGDSHESVQCCIALAEMHITAGEHDKARSILDEAEPSMADVRDENVRIAFDLARARVYLALSGGDTKTARTLARRSLLSSRRLGLPEHIAGAACVLARAHMASRRGKLARRYLSLALVELRGISDRLSDGRMRTTFLSRSICREVLSLTEELSHDRDRGKSGAREST